LHLGLSKENIHEALAKPIIADMRMQIEACPHGWLIVDCYNANPVSMQAALEFWRDYHPELPHLAILGDMLELGETAGMNHNMVGAMLAEIPHQGLYTVGNYARAYHQDVSRHYSTVDELLQQLPEFPKQSVILIKASHGIHLEKLLPKLRGVN